MSSSSRNLIAALFLGVMLLSPQRVDGQAQIVMSQLDTLAVLMSNEGLSPEGDRRLGTLRQGGTETLSFELRGSVSYVIAGVCDANCFHMDLAIWSTGGQLLAEDPAVDDFPLLTFTTPSAGTYTLQVNMQGCSEGSCGFGIATFASGDGAIPMGGGTPPVTEPVAGGGTEGVGGGGDPELDRLLDTWELPLRGTTALRAGFLPDPFTVDVEGFGEIRNPVSGCAGFVPIGPEFALDFTAGSQPAALYLYAESNSGRDDLNLLVRRPDGRWLCDDDSLGSLNPLVVVEAAGSGRYHIWVGTYTESRPEESGFEEAWAVLSISEFDPRP